MSRSPDLYGWDTAFALRVADFNRLIAAESDAGHRVYPAAGQPASSSVAWGFGSWQIVAATGSQVTIAMPFQPGSVLTITGQEVPLSGCSCVVTAEMVFKPLDTPGASVLTAVAGRQWAAVTIDGPLEFAPQAELTRLFDEWFATPEAVTVFNAHFDGVNVATALAGNGVPWLTPRAVGYAGATLPDTKLAIGVLARVSRADAIGAQYMLSPFAIPDPAAAGFVIAAPRVLEQLILPALVKAFGVSKTQSATAFKVVDGRLTNQVPLTLRLAGASGKQYPATVDAKALATWIEGDALVLSLDMHFEVDLAGVAVETVQISMVEHLQATLLSPAHDASHHVFMLSQSGKPQIQHDEEETLAALGGELLIDLVTAIVQVLLMKYGVAGLKARGLSPLAAKIVAGLLTVVAQEAGTLLADLPDIATSIAEEDLEKMPDFGTLLDVALDSVHWRTDSRFELQSVQFADNLQIGVAVN